MILDLVGFISTHFQPKPSHVDPFHTNFSKYVTFKTRELRSGRLPSANNSQNMLPDLIAF